jgi:predicted membrane protein
LAPYRDRRQVRAGRAGRHRLLQRDPLWPAQVALLAAILLGLALSEQLTIGPFWMVPACESVLLLANIVTTPRPPTRMGFGQAALRSAVQGAVIGALFGWIFGLFNWINPVVASITLAFYGLIFGAVLGALLGLLLHGMTGGRRDFASVRGMEASRYEVQADEEVADEAARLLTEQPARS